MWRITQVYAKNIISFKEMRYTIEQGVTTLIFGRNLDNDNQKNNGSGKSSLCEAIAFGLTGESFKKVSSLDDIINNYEEEAEVELTLSNTYDKTSFTVYRRISRQEPQLIECHMYAENGEEIATDMTVQPTVNDYNKFILDVIGLSKDDLYYNYLLNRKRFKCFFTASDKDKKAIINRFSNGVIVDESIEKLQEDIEPLKESIRQQELKVAALDGKIAVLTEQISNADMAASEQARNREERIQSIRTSIGDIRNQITESKENIEKANERIKLIGELDVWLQDQEASEDGLEESYRKIIEKFADNKIVAIANYTEKLQMIKQGLDNYVYQTEQLLEEIDKCKRASNELQGTYDTLFADYGKAKQQYSQDNEKDSAEITTMMKSLEVLHGDIKKIDSKIADNDKRIVKLKTAINGLNVIINGAITCPKCGHVFFANSDKDVDDTKMELQGLQNELEELTQERDDDAETVQDLRKQSGEMGESIESIRNNITSRNATLDETNKKVRILKSQVDMLADKISTKEMELGSSQKKFSIAQEDLSHLKQKMFDEAFDNIDSATAKGKQYVQSCQDNIARLTAAIQAYESTIQDIESTKVENLKGTFIANKDQVEKELAVVEDQLQETKNQLQELEIQHLQFQNFKSYLANQKIEAIADSVNNFLAEIGSDMSVELSGYKTLKTGKLKENITVHLLRDGVDQGDFAKFSGGEQGRIVLASILAMAKLTNANCADGKGLDFLIIDEILDASDASGFDSFTEAINHLGVTCLMITQGAMVEGYPHQLIVQKEGGYSTIIQ